MPSTKDTNSNNHGLFALFKGAPNTAKSGAAYSFPNPFVFDFDRKMPTVALKHFPDKEFNWECFDDVFQVSDFLRPWLSTGSDHVVCPYETLIIDSVTSLSTLCLLSVDKTKGTSVVEMMKHAQKSKDSGAISVEVMGMDYYNAEANYFERYLINNLKILWSRNEWPRHIIVIAHEMTVESAPDLKTGFVRVTNSILTAGRKAAVFIPKAFDEEYLFSNEMPSLGDTLSKTKRICRTSNKDTARSGYRFPEVIDFTNKSLYDELNKVAKWF